MILFRRHLTSLCHVDTNLRFAVNRERGYWKTPDVYHTRRHELDLSQRSQEHRPRKKTKNNSE